MKPQPKPAPTQRVYSVRRQDGGWVSEFADIPMDVFKQYVTESHGPDIFAMCVGKVENEMQHQPERV